MLSSPTLSWTLTGVFAVTGAAALVRLVRRVPGPRSDGRTAELAHLLMSVAMTAMVWGRGGGPGTALGAVQIAVFALLAVSLLVSATRGRAGGRLHGRVGAACHLLTTLATVWMVAATPALTGTGESMDMGAAPRPAGWAAVDVAVVVLLVAVAAWWALRVRRPVPAPRGPRVHHDGLGALCHLLMSLGMASMLLAML